ncbi:hypothetical protein ABW20_dc0108437 [Dactylellina cionopaga]|nr:hypothetical protein ABW20_dc0108437 [Dactylellina cionopaga]
MDQKLEMKFKYAKDKYGHQVFTPRHLVGWLKPFLGSHDYMDSWAWKTLRPIFVFLLPSFISSQHSDNKPPAHKLTSTSWLDGLRGIACFIVFIHHYNHAYFETEKYAYDGYRNSYILQWPTIRIIHSGGAMVAIFYIISGFALSYKSVGLMKKPISHANSHAILSNLASSIWKRYLRLMVPCAASLFLVSFFVAAGWFEAVPYLGKGLLRGVVEFRPARASSIYGQLQMAVRDLYKFAIHVTLFNDWDTFGELEANEHLWTIAIEFQRSLLLFLTIAGLSHIKRWLRMGLFLPVFVLLAVHNGFWDYSLFIFGFLLAEIHANIHAYDEGNAPKSPNSVHLPMYNATAPRTQNSKILKTSIMSFLLFIGIHMASFPEHMPYPGYSIGFRNLSMLTPSSYNGMAGYRYWTSVGSMLIVFAIAYLPKIQNFLCTQPLQYLGRISFSLYLVHGTMNRSLGYALVHWGWRCMGVDAMWKEGVVLTPEKMKSLETLRISLVLMVFLVNVPVTIWVSDIFWRVVDTGSVKFIRWLESKIVRS